MTVKISRAQADTLRAIKRGMNTSPPLVRATLEVLVRDGYVREVFEPRHQYELTEEGAKFCR